MKLQFITKKYEEKKVNTINFDLNNIFYPIKKKNRIILF